MNLISAFVRRPVTTVMMVLVFVVLGAVAYRRMTVDLFPEVDFPLVQVIMVYPGAGPDEIESQMVKKIEDEISNISDIKMMQSQIFEGYALTIVRFNLGVDVDIKSLEVKDKIEQIKRDLPDAAEDPVIAKFDPLATPVVKLAVTSDSMSARDLYELSDKELKDRIAQVTGVAKVEIIGGAKRQINVWADLDKLAHYGLTVMDLMEALGQNSIDIPAGNIEKERREIGVRFKGEAKTVDAVANLAFPVPGKGVIRVKDVARVEDGAEQAKSLVRYRGKEAVLLDVYKRSDGNTVLVADSMYGVVSDLKESLPPGVEIFIADDASTYIRDAVSNANSSIFLGVLFCALMLWIFLRDARITLVAAVVIPTSIVSAFLLMDAFGFTRNIMTLAALGITIGTLVANAIVVIENISRHVEEGAPSGKAAITGTSEIAVAVLASAGTNIVVFTPIAFMGGIVGQFFYQFGLTVVFATIFSLIASFSLTPMLSSLAFRGASRERAEKPRFFLTKIVHAPLMAFKGAVDETEKSYGDTLRTALRWPKLTMAISFLAIFTIVPMAMNTGAEFFPAADEGKLTIRAQLPKGANYRAADEVLRDIEEVVRTGIGDDLLVDYTAQAGGENTGFDEAEVLIRLVKSTEREVSQDEIMYQLQPALARIPGAEIYMKRTEQSGPGESDLDIDIYGPDYGRLAALSEELREKAMATGNFRAIFNTYREPKDEVHFIPGSYKRADYMTPNAALGMVLRYSVEGEDATVLRMGGEEYDIRVRMEERSRNSVEDLLTYQAPTAMGMAPLAQLGEFKRAKGIANLDRKDKRRVIYLRSFFAKATMGENQKLLDRVFKEVDFPPGYGYKFSGSAEENEEAQTNILVAFGLAFILTYMLLAAILNSFAHPFTIGMTVPLGMIGVFATLFFAGLSINIMSMISMVMLVGIVVNNGILIIDYALQRMNSCSDSVEECVQVASVTKFRAVLMTNLAILAGIAPQIFGGSGTEYLVPIAAATMGGVAVSTLFTFYTVPAFFVLVQRFTGWLKRLFRVSGGNEPGGNEPGGPAGPGTGAKGPEAKGGGAAGRDQAKGAIKDTSKSPGSGADLGRKKE